MLFLNIVVILSSDLSVKAFQKPINPVSSKDAFEKEN